MSYLKLPQDPNITPDWNPYKMAPSNNFALENPYPNPHKTASQNMSVLDRLSNRLTSMPLSQAPPRERNKIYTPHEVTTVEDVWELLYRQARGSLPVITSRSAVEDIRKASLYPMASLEQLTWLGKLENGDHSIIHQVLIMLEYMAGMVDTSSESQKTLKLHEELVGIINICRGINGHQDWYGNGIYGWETGHGWNLSAEEALEYLGDILKQWNPTKWRREGAMWESGGQTWTSSADAVNKALKVSGWRGNHTPYLEHDGVDVA